MTTLLFTHAACLDHDPGLRHPERPARLAAVLRALDDPAFRALDRREAPRATMEQLGRVHRPDYVDQVLASTPPQGCLHLDPDTAISPGSDQAALRAAGAVCAAVDAVVAGEGANAFCAVRPPGHHAERGAAMGFCLFNNVAVGAVHAQAAHAIRRVAVVDFDVHHGNGTQHMFEHNVDLLYASTHQYPYYPGTGAAEETGIGNIVNVPLRAHSGSREFRTAFQRTILPALDGFAPDLLMISAGFDAHVADPLANLALDEADFTWVTTELMAVARRHSGGRIVSTLEGGYDLGALASSAAAHVAALLAA
ncbi:MAG: histone deacetylase family protein [Alphaproteobacteria bacterium]|nr:histone deacetylase family protein [Alphaproteobacteria bacterium]